MSSAITPQVINQLRTTIDWLSKTVLEKIREEEFDAVPALLQERQQAIVALVTQASADKTNHVVLKQYLQERQQLDEEITQALRLSQARIGKSVTNMKCILEYTRL